MNLNHNHNHKNNSIITLCNYASQHIYNIIDIRKSFLDNNQKHIKIQSIFKELVNNIRILTKTDELDMNNTPMGFLFQHLRPIIIQLVANCSPKNDKLFIEKALLCNIEWNIRIFNALINLGSRDILIWFFLHVPYYNEESIESIQKDIKRETYLKMLEYFNDNYPSNLYFTEKEFVFLSNQTCMPYAISYHNRNNVLILSTYSKLLRKICPWLNYYSPNLAEKILKEKYNSNTTQNTIQNTTKKQICFISDSFTTDTSVLRDRVSIIGKLDRNKYDVYFASFYPFEYIKGIIAKVFMDKIKNNYIYLGNNLISARNVLEPYKFDFIVYPDIGMKLLPTLLAYSRIAPVQMTTWGHSETSGIDTIDYFISSEYFESKLSLQEAQSQAYSKAQSHYTEKLILFKSLGTFYISPHKLFIDNNPKYQIQEPSVPSVHSQKDKIKKFKTREQQGYNNTQNLYVCLQTFYKLNSEFETCMARILELDPNGIILLSNTFPFCKSHLKRMKHIIGDQKIRRLRWHGSLEKDEFLNLVSICDVCLDPFPFGGFNTSYDAFDYNIPVVTLECEYLHGLFTSGLYRKMGLDECIVHTSEEYAKLASSIGINDKLRHKINRNIEMKKHLIFQEQESVEEWNELFTRLV
jgi:predicted O-linked N-acetylglucosamine transferase (SPINDLY family)